MAEGCLRIEPLLSAWLDGELDPSTAEDVGVHLRGCVACLKEADTLALVRAAVRNLPTRAAAGVSNAPGPFGVPGVPADDHTEEEGTRASRSRRAAMVASVALGVLGVSAALLGGGPAPDTPMVKVPVEVFVADHLVHTVEAPIGTPVLVEAQR